ncbi:hypothetical protein ACF0H5_006570 [Mactra antiquata]
MEIKYIICGLQTKFAWTCYIFTMLFRFDNNTSPILPSSRLWPSGSLQDSESGGSGSILSLDRSYTSMKIQYSIFIFLLKGRCFQLLVEGYTSSGTRKVSRKAR